MQRQTLAKLVKLLFILLLLIQPGGDIVLNIQTHRQGSAYLLPLLSQHLRVLGQRLRLGGFPLKLGGEGIHLTQHQQAFLFEGGDLFFHRLPATLVFGKR